MCALFTVDQSQEPAMRLHELGGNDKAKTRTTFLGRTMKRLEQVLSCPLGNAGTVVRDIDDDLASLPMRRDANLSVCLAFDTFYGLSSIAHQIAQDAKQ